MPEIYFKDGIHPEQAKVYCAGVLASLLSAAEMLEEARRHFEDQNGPRDFLMGIAYCIQELQELSTTMEMEQAAMGDG